MTLVKAHEHGASEVAAGLAHLPDTATPFAATQAAWRFFNNPRVTLPALAEPLHETAHQALATSQAACALVIHDWSKLDYRRHTTKRDVVQLTHATDIGYELATALLVRADDGAPLAPLEIRVETAQAVHTSRPTPVACGVDHLDQVLPAMQAVASIIPERPLVHVIDREADSVGHFRRWQADGRWFLVRADDRRVRWRGQEPLLSEIAATLEQEQAFALARDIEFHGRPAKQEVAETTVVLHRPAKERQPDGSQRAVPGPPLTLRLVVARVRDDAGNLLAEWLLLTNVPGEWADAARIALWYYWRWRIESYHKLLKSAGHQIEHWQQETGEAITRRLLVAAMACVVVWQLERTQTPEAEQLKDVLIQLSGRQMKYGHTSTAPALLAGLHVLLAMLSLLEHHDLNDLRDLAAAALPLFQSG